MLLLYQKAKMKKEKKAYSIVKKKFDQSDTWIPFVHRLQLSLVSKVGKMSWFPSTLLFPNLSEII